MDKGRIYTRNKTPYEKYKFELDDIIFCIWQRPENVDFLDQVVNRYLNNEKGDLILFKKINDKCRNLTWEPKTSAHQAVNRYIRALDWHIEKRWTEYFQKIGNTMIYENIKHLKLKRARKLVGLDTDVFSMYEVEKALKKGSRKLYDEMNSINMDRRHGAVIHIRRMELKRILRKETEWNTAK